MTRRIFMVPLVVLLEIAMLVTAPLSIGVAAIAGLVHRSSRPIRATALVLTYAAIELSTLARIASGVDDWDALERDVLDRGYRAMRRILDIPLELEPGSATAGDLAASNGVIVLARHCGPGDSLFIAWLLAVPYALTMSIVLKDALRWEPTVNVAEDHLPLCFVRAGQGRGTAAVRSVAEQLGPGRCLLLFPEGGNFSWERWRAAIRGFVERREFAAARRAQRQTHTLPARPGGALAALQAAPHADVLLLAHSGFSTDGRDRPWWRVPMHRPLLVRTVLLPAHAVPRDEDGARAFLDQAWEQIDTWVDGHAALMELAERLEAG